MKSDFLIAVTQLAAERGLPKESVVAAVEAALVSAYKKDTVAAGHNITVRLNPNDGEVKVFALKTVVEEVEDDRKELTPKEAQKHVPNAALGDTVELETYFPSAGRIAAQTAKQVVIQRLREAERELVLAEFTNRVGDILAGRIERREPQHVVVSLGRAEAIMPQEEQVHTERYRPNQTLQFFLVEVATSLRGPELILSRAHPNLLRRLFEREVPEIYSGTVELKGIAREAGSRSKVAVSSRQEGVDPVGSCVGLRGFRIQNIVNELQGEKIDVVQWHIDQSVFLANALSPAQVLQVDFGEDQEDATVVVPDTQLSLAIGREGQNVRLAAKLTGWRIDIKGLSEHEGVQGGQPVTETEGVEAAQEPVTAEVQEVAPEPEPVMEAPSLEATEAPAKELEEAAPALVTEELPVEEPQPEVSTEEELLAQEALEEETVEEEESEGLAADDERVWAVPNIATGPSVLRFAEDIMPERSQGPARRGRRGGGGDRDRGRPRGGRSGPRQTGSGGPPQPSRR